MGSLKKNFLFTASYQLINMLLPLITAPYISRVLGAQTLGTYTYTFTLAGYFLMFANLGFSFHGRRIIAANKGERATISRSFTEIYMLQLIAAAGVTACYLLYVAFIADKSFRILYLIQILYVASSIVDISWLFFGVENFKTTSIRNFAIKFITVVAIFLFVKSPDDVTMYALIMAGGTFLSQVVLWIGVPCIVDIKREYWSFNFAHVKRSVILFIPVIAVSLYTVMDKLMLGRIAGMDELAFYENAHKVISVPVGLITAFETVMLPRMVNLTAKKDTYRVNKLLDESFSLVMMAGAPMMCGLMAVSELLTDIMFGSAFERTADVMVILSITILFTLWAGIIRKEILVPRNLDKEYVISVFFGAVINLGLNFVLIPKYGSTGAAYATVAAEAGVCIYQTVITRKTQPYKKHLTNNFLFLLASIVMGVFVYVVSRLLPSTVLSLVSVVFIGILVYAVMFAIVIKITGKSFKDSLLFKNKGD